MAADHAPAGDAPATLGPDTLTPALLTGLLAASREGIVVVDAARRYLYVNPVGCAILGYSLPELLGRDFLFNFPEHEHAEMREHFEASLAGKPGLWRAVIVRPDGEEREIEYSNMAFSVEGEPRAAAIFRDVTDMRRQAREARALAHIAASLTVDQPVETMLDTVALTVVEATRAVAASVVLVDEPTRQPRLVGTHGLPAGYAAAMEAAWTAGAPLPTLLVIGAQQPFVLNDTRALMREEPLYAPVHPYLAEVAWDVVVSVPLVYRGRALGALNAYYPPAPGPLTSEISLLTAIAGQAAVAVENARLFGEAQWKAALEERQRLARELHDSVTQALYGIALGARTARTLLDRDPAKAVQPVEYVQSLAEAGMAEMRALMFELRPETLALEGLVAALEKQAASLRARHKLTVTAELCPEPDAALPVKEAIYRIAQETLANTVRHGHARHVTIRLSADSAAIHLEIADDGAGFDPGAEHPGQFGVRSLPERAAKFGGTVQVESAPGEGTRVTVMMPRRTPAQPGAGSLAGA